MVNIATLRRAHFIGIGGVGMSALARLLLAAGKEISGTEDNDSPETLNGLRAQGVVISQDLDPAHLPAADVYVYSDAWLTKHPDVLAEAKSRGVPALSYFEALGEIANQSRCLIAVAGAHGKTSTTAMLIDVLEAAGLDPSGVVGSLRAKTKSNYRAGGGDFFVVEADEWRRHFLNFSPRLLVITNIDADHLDYYRDLADVQSAFRALVQKIPADGFVVCDPSDDKVAPALESAGCTVIDYKKYFDPALPLKVLPLHRINAAAVLAVADILGVDQAVARQAIAEFAGTWRRFEYKGETINGASVYDDYGHHPTEVAATLKSVREQFPDRHLVIVFHPHLYSRTKALMEEFAGAFSDADEVLLAPIFAAREAPDPSVSSDLLAGKIRAHGTPARAYASLEEILRALEARSSPLEARTLILTMGAGDIYKVGERLIQKKSVPASG